jgi:hypothetical protein
LYRDIYKETGLAARIDGKSISVWWIRAIAPTKGYKATASRTRLLA